MVLIMLGLLGSNVYKVEQAVLIDAKPGASASLNGYTLTFAGYRQSLGPQNAQRTFATFDVIRGGTRSACSSRTRTCTQRRQLAVRAVILGSMGQDLFVTPNAPFDASTSQLSLQMDVFPLMRLVWIGALALVAGAGVSLWPKRVAVRAAETAAEPAEA